MTFELEEALRLENARLRAALAAAQRQIVELNKKVNRARVDELERKKHA